MHRLIHRFSMHILIISAIISLVAIFFALRLKLDLNFISLLPAGHPGVDAFIDVGESIGMQSTLIAVVDIPAQMDQGDAEVVVEHLCQAFAQSPLITTLEYKANTKYLSNLLHVFLDYFPQLMKTSDLNALARKLTDEGIRGQILENKKLLMTPVGIAAKDLVSMDPLALRDFLTPYLTVSTGSQTIKHPSGYYRTKAGSYVIFLKPIRPPQDIAFSKKLIEDLRRRQQRALSDLSTQSAGIPPTITISYTGGYAIAVEDEAATKKDIQIMLVTSFLGVMALFRLAFRSLKILILVGLPLTLSLLWTLGFAGIVFRNLNVLTCIFACVLIGLGIDFAIHFVNRFFNEDHSHLSAFQRLQLTFQESGTGILVGAVTTAAAFFCVGISDFRGFRELGILTGVGILICLLIMFSLLPALIVRHGQKEQVNRKMAIASFGLQPILALVQKTPRSVLLTTAAIVALLAYLGSGIKFDDNLRNFRAFDSNVFRLQDKIADWLGGSTASILLIAEDSSEAQVVDTTASIYAALKELNDTGKIAGIQSISRYFPAPDRQRANMAFIKQHAGLFNLRRIKQTFDQALIENGFEILDRYNDYFGHLAKAFAQDQLFLPTALRDKDLKQLLKLFYIQKKGLFQTITYIRPNKDLWSNADTLFFKDMIDHTLEAKQIPQNRYLLTGTALLTGELKTLVMDNFKTSLGFAAAAIIVVLLIYYRSLKLVLLAISPLLIGLVSLVGIMTVLGLDFNFINLIVIPMIVGIGIDDGVHLTNAFRQCHSLKGSEAILITGRAAILTSLTTLVGFGSIGFSHYPGLRSMGIVAVIGISACMLASIIVLPAIFAIIGRQ